MNYCMECGSKIDAVIEGNRVCNYCGKVYYDNPIVGVTGVYVKDDKVLLGKRKGRQEDMWCMPCGYLEREDVVEGMKREFKEETNLEVLECELYDVHSNFHNEDVPTVGVYYYVTKTKGILRAMDDLKDVGYFGKEELPELAFPSDKKVIKRMIKEGKL